MPSTRDRMALTAISTERNSTVWPAEWFPHRESIVVWPGRPEVWGVHLPDARREFENVVATIASHEHVRLVVAATHTDSLPRQLRESESVSVAEIDTDDAWARDTAPLFVLD